MKKKDSVVNQWQPLQVETILALPHTLGELEDVGAITLGRGKVISKIDIRDNPGDYPVYSSSAHGNGEIGRYGSFMFDDERLTWSIDGGGRMFYRPAHRYSVTNVCGWLKVNVKEIFPKFLYYLLSARWALMTFDYIHKAHPSIIRVEYTNLKFPPLPVQREIVARLEKELGKADELADKGKRLGALADELFKSELDAAFKNVKGEKVRLGDVCEVRAGATHHGIESEKGRFPVYGSGGYICQATNYRCPANTITVGRKGTLDKPLLIKEPFWNIDTCFGLVVKQGLDPEYLWRFCQGFDFYSLVPSIGRPSTNSDAIKEIKIPLPPISVQHEIVARLEKELGKANELAAKGKRLKELAAELRKSILQEAFA